jgi:hypothetical protein
MATADHALVHRRQCLEKYYSDWNDELLIATRYPAFDSIRFVQQHPNGRVNFESTVCDVSLFPKVDNR